MILRMDRTGQVRRDHYMKTGDWLPEAIEVDLDERSLTAEDRRRLLEFYRVRPGQQILVLRRPTTLGSEYRPNNGSLVSVLEVAEVPTPEQAPAFLAAHLEEWEAALAEGEERERRRREEATAAQREREQAAAAQRQAEAEAEARLRAWAEAHGSELLRARVAEGFRWAGLARQEFADAVLATVLEAVPGLERCDFGRDDDRLTYEERVTPTLAEIERLRQVRRAIEQASLPAVAELLWVDYVDPDGPDGPDDGTRTELRITVTTPDGREVARFTVDAEAGVAVSFKCEEDDDD